MLGTNVRRAVIVGCLSLASCADDASEGGACGVTPCGGDIVGDWQISDVCGMDAIVSAVDPGFEGCTGASIDGAGLQITGPTSLTAAGTYTSAMTLGGSMRMSIPADCLEDEASGMQLTCDQLNTALQQSLMGGADAPFQAVSCTGSSSCTCEIELVPQVNEETGTYVVAGSKVTMTNSDNEVEESDFCVEGSTLSVTGPPEMVNGKAVRMSLTLTK
jgi:hypothetical protein